MQTSKIQKINDMYASKACDYAAQDKKKWLVPSLTAIKLRECIQRIKPNSILDLGMGTGRYFPYLSGRTFVGVDICQSMMDIAEPRRDLLLKRGFSDVVFLNNDVTNYIYKTTDQYDFIYSVGCLGFHVPLTMQLMVSLAEKLKKNGALFMQTTQASLGWQVRNIIDRAFEKRRLNGNLYSPIAIKKIRELAARALLKEEWVIIDPKVVWFQKPVVISLFKKT